MSKTLAPVAALAIALALGACAPGEKLNTIPWNPSAGNQTNFKVASADELRALGAGSTAERDCKAVSLIVRAKEKNGDLQQANQWLQIAKDQGCAAETAW
jgi:hypothetical protein